MDKASTFNPESKLPRSHQLQDAADFVEYATALDVESDVLFQSRGDLWIVWTILRVPPRARTGKSQPPEVHGKETS